MTNSTRKIHVVTLAPVSVWLGHWLPPVLWMSGMLLFSGDLGSGKNTFLLLRWLLAWIPGITGRDIMMINFYFRKLVGHFGTYAILYLLWFRAWRGHLGWSRMPALAAALILCLAVSLVDEGHQMLLPTRIGSLEDVGIDMLGVSAAALTSWFIWKPAAPPDTGERQ